jgi:hypothetical protein
MNFYTDDPVKLREWLRPYIGGQFQIETSDVGSLRGNILSLEVSTSKIVKITYGFLYESHDSNFEKSKGKRTNIKWTFHENHVPLSRKVVMEFSPGFIYFNYLRYYYQSKEMRIKLKSAKEICRFHLPGDSQNIQIV